MTRLEVWFSWLAVGLLRAAAVLVVGMTTFVILSALMRYGLGAPFAFTEEVVGLMYVATAFLTIPLSTLRREHISVQSGPARAGLRGRAVLACLAECVMIAFVVWFTVDTARFTLFSREIGARSEQVEILLWPWMAVMGIAMAISLAASLIHLVRSIAAIKNGGALPGSGEAKEFA